MSISLKQLAEDVAVALLVLFAAAHFVIVVAALVLGIPGA